MKSSAVSPDGSPIAIYRALPAMGEPELIHAASQPQARILELGCGAGRITHGLVKLGHHVVAVDNCEEMLRWVRGAETVLSDIETLELQQRFDTVVLASHFINTPEERKREMFLRICGRHLENDGVVIVQRYSPELLQAQDSTQTQYGDVFLSFHVESAEPASGHFTAKATYRLGSTSWEQDFEAQILTDESFSRLVSLVNMCIAQWLDDRHTWATLKLDGKTT